MHSLKKKSDLSSRVLVIGEKITITCKFCEFLCRDLDDQISIKESGVCTDCKTNFFYLLKSNKEDSFPTVEFSRSKMIWKA
jgi:hypothetical protein